MKRLRCISCSSKSSSSSIVSSRSRFRCWWDWWGVSVQPSSSRSFSYNFEDLDDDDDQMFEVYQLSRIYGFRWSMVDRRLYQLIHCPLSSVEKFQPLLHAWNKIFFSHLHPNYFWGAMCKIFFMKICFK